MKLTLPFLVSLTMTVQAAEPPPVVSSNTKPAAAPVGAAPVAVTSANPEFDAWINKMDALYRVPYERDVVAVFAAGQNELKQKYLAALTSLLNNATEIAQVTEINFLRDERQHVFDGQSLPADDTDNPPGGLASVRVAQRAQLAKLEAEHARLSRLHFERYDKFLAEAQARLMQTRRADDAKVLLAKREEIAKSWLPAAPAPTPGAVASPARSASAVPVANTSKAAVRETVEWLLEAGAELYSSEGTKELRVWDTKGLVNTRGAITRVMIDGKKMAAPLKAADLQRIGSLKDLKIFDLRATPADDQALAFLPQLESLERISINDVQCTDLLISYVAGHTKLKAFRCHAKGITGQTLEELASSRELRTLDLNDCGIVDESATAISHLSQLEVLLLNKTKVTNAALPTLANLANLTEIGLEATAVTIQGLQALKGLKRLENLQYLTTGISDLGEAARAIGAAFPKVTSWRLGGDRVSAEHLQALGQLRSLERLAIHGKLEPGALAGLSGVPSLAKLALHTSDRTDADLEPLAALKSLKSIEIDMAKSLTEAFLEKMRKCRNLKELRLYDTNISPQAFAAFEKQLPGCKVLK